MESVRPRESDRGYFRTLIGAGMDGIATARREQPGGIFQPSLYTAVWPPLAIGATVGALGGRLSGKRKGSTIAVGTLVGTAIGIGAALAWASRRFTGSAVRRATQSVNASRDRLWLRSHPIDYA
jgi:hypothetical protein